MVLLRLIEKYFWCFFTGAIILGLMSESIGTLFEDYLRLFLMAILFFTSLKVDFQKIWDYATSPFLVIYMMAIKLFLSPLMLYYLSILIFPTYALGMLILNSMPSAMYSGTMSDIAGGSIERAFAGTIYTSLVCPLTVPLITNILMGEAIHFRIILPKVQFLTLMIFIPFFMAWLTKRLFSETVKRYSSCYTPLSIISSCILISAGISKNRNFVFENLDSVIFLIPYLIIVFALLLLLGYFSVFFLPKKDRIAFAVNTAFMNNGLAIVFSLSYLMGDLRSEAILPSILVEIPMAFMIVPLRFFVNRKKS